LAAGIGPVLRTIRQQWQLSLREVEKRSLCFARERGNRSYRVSASWLNRLEREEHEVTVNKLLVLAHIYRVPPEQLLRSEYTTGTPPRLHKQLFEPHATKLLMQGPPSKQTTHLLQDELYPGQSPDETALLSLEESSLPTSYRWGIIGKRDRSLEPMIPAGSLVQIDTRGRTISSRKGWARPSS
jgi:transcriptional regulator with XRE-family HTH domain